MKRIAVWLAGVLLVIGGAPSDAQEWGLITREPGTFEGYTLFAPLLFEKTYLIDMEGKLVHQWESDLRPAGPVYLLEDGRLLRPEHLTDNPTFGNRNPGGGRVRIYEWDGTIVWDYKISDEKRLAHHDVTPMPNGNVLMLVWELRTKEEAITAGRDPARLTDGRLFPETIIEVKPAGPESGEIVWEWKLWDHLIQDFDAKKQNYGRVEEHPELLDLNFTLRDGADWNHSNGIDYNEELDQVVVSMRSMNEFYIIDHSTTTKEAAGHSGGKRGRGGDFLYRWGNPQVYRRGTEQDRKLFLQHHSHWAPKGTPGAGNLLVFNNGSGRPGGNSSSVEEMAPPLDADGTYKLGLGAAFKPDRPVWMYRAPHPADFYSSFISGLQRLPNGNTLICSGAQSRFFEVTSGGKIVWEYRSAFGRPDAPVKAGGMLEPGQKPGNLRGVGVFRATRYAPDYQGLAEHLHLP